MSTLPQPLVIIVEVLGFGGGGDGESKDKDIEEERRRSRGQRSQMLDSPYQVLGAGEMSVDEARQIIAERRQASRH